jgi:membrane protein DedA with SNARE-associated domain
VQIDALIDLVSGSSWSYLVILAVAAIDVLLPIVPSEATVISAGVLAGAGELELALVVAAGAVGAYSGDSAAFWLGRRFGPRVERRVFRGDRGASRRAWASNALERHGGPLIFGSRFVPAGRTATIVTAGLLRMPWARFAVYAGAAGIAWASYAALVGFLGGRAFEDKPLYGLALGFGLAALVYVVIETVRRVRGRRGRRPTISATGA